MNILHIDCSPRPQSQSRQLSESVVRRLLTFHPGARVSRRDLGSEPIAHPDASYASALASPAGLASASGDALRLSEELIVEVEEADILVIGTPMNNFTVPSVLKAWVDQIVRIGRTFVPTPTGKSGLLRDRPVYVAVASGGIFSGERANQPDFLTPYLSAILSCVGLNTVHVLPLQGTAFLDEEIASATRDALVATIDGRATGAGRSQQAC
ncbi:FMN-dependent NADH-azoreductase [Chelatococcus reniformis]|uniref:FMN dependent NADH:quinone oxidoreductase n=1 Tax=Chelatococcus reniformis TaxID=1494448 RepID=A0A916X6Q7_9HYPH|nr:NAD(P)H-dependent oxidoreductase [Chelatococcus reniformis]GGC45816.1 FMN-dependent NADH-azoreductase [Chelatococcus reniformis]